MKKLHPRAIIFDLGSTLIEYEAIPWDELGVYCIDSGRRFLLERGHKLPVQQEFLAAYERIRDTYRRLATRSLVEWDVPAVAAKLLREYGIEPHQEVIDGFFDAYYKPVDERLFVYEDTIGTLELLARSYPVMGLISNTVFPERVHLQELERFGIAPFLRFSVFSSTFGLRKPHQDIFIHAANLAGFAPSECVYVGDRYLEDIQGPLRIGMEAILKIKPDRDYPEQMPEAKRRIECLASLTEHLEL